MVWSSCRLAGLLAGALAGVLLGDGRTALGQTPARRGPEPRAAIELTTRQAGDAGGVQAVLPDPAVVHPQRLAVSDVMLLVSADDGNVDAAMTLTNGVPASARLFRARLIAVVGGRLLAHATAACGGWQGDVSRCRVACEGGIFTLRRRPGGVEAGYTLLIGRASDRPGLDDGRDGVLLSSCDRESDAEVRLQPASGRETAEIDLRAE